MRTKFISLFLSLTVCACATVSTRTSNPQSSEDLFQQGRVKFQQKNFSQAAQFFKQACEQNHIFACNDLGYLYQQGQGVPLDYAKAFSLYEKSCQAKDASACNNLGTLYKDGQGVKQDFQQANRFFEQGCQGKDMPACYNLGNSY
ncbi:MAG: sel1 repeat family protein, partial [Neisseriaceae bacterium]|nr:sel1 repeat family protein [Neisseriaceae bacterium]